MEGLRILLLNHGRAADLMGGDSVQIAATAKGLRRRGYHVTVACSDHPDTSDCDLVHIYNARTATSLAGQLASARESRTPVVVSPIWISLTQARWGSLATRGVLEQLQKRLDGGERLLSQLIDRRLAVSCDGEVLRFDSAGDSTTKRLEQISTLLRDVEFMLPNSWLELAALRRDLAWHGTSAEIAPYGVDPGLFNDPDPGLFRSQSGITGPFIIQAGRVEPPKNPAMLLYAMRDSNLPIVLVGRNDVDPSYTDLCRSIGGDKVHFFGHMPPHLLASAYAGASVHALPSWCETCGLVSLEAALAGTPVVASIAGHEAAYLESDAWYCDPANPMSIRSAIEAALSAGPRADKVRRLRNRIRTQYHWDNMVDASEKTYMLLMGTRLR